MPTLSNTLDYTSYRRRLFDFLPSKHGQAGYSVVHDQENDHETRKPIEPQANDVFFNERTGEPTSQPRFEWEKLSEKDKKGKSESEIAAIEASLPLSSAGREDYRKEHAQYRQAYGAWERTQTANKDHDDNCVTEILSTLTESALETIKSHPDFKDYQALTFICANRALFLWRIIDKSMNKINVTQTCESLTDYLSSKQDPQQSNASFIQMVSDRAAYAKSTLTHPGKPGFVSLNTLQSLVLIAGVRRSAGTKEALKMYYQANPDIGGLANTSELEHMLYTYANNRDYADDDDQMMTTPTGLTATPKTAALKATKREVGSRIPSRTDHCTKCYEIAKKFIYGHTPAECLRKGQSDSSSAKSQTDSSSAKRPSTSKISASIACLVAANLISAEDAASLEDQDD